MWLVILDLLFSDIWWLWETKPRKQCKPVTQKEDQ